MTRIMVVDDHPVVREGIVAALSADDDFEVTADAASSEEALQLARSVDPDVVVLDMRLGAADGGAQLCADLRDALPRVRVVVFTSYPSELTMLDAFRAGATGFLVKDSDVNLLRQAVRTVADGGTFVDSRVASKLVDVATKGRRAKGPFNLTMQEMRVLALLPRGLSNRQIGAELGLSEQTVKSHLQHAMAKLRVHDRTEAAAIAIREGLA
jgi:DNA-binding NarL/FixJ family response regulator